MSILSINGLGLAYGARDVFTGISAELPKDAKVGLVGPNGVGKTSLFRILAGLMEPSAGSVRTARGTRMGYLRQEAVEAFAGHDFSLYDEMLAVFAPVLATGERLREMEARMASGDVSEALLEQYGTDQHEFERAGGYDYDARIQQVLEGLGFSADHWGLPIARLSGGQKTRALLARLLLEQPDLLIMDEPTNHLDVEAVEWLERTLRSWQGALLMASHDRTFLDRVVDHIWEMSPEGIEIYTGNYTAYLRQRDERWERNRVVYESEMERLRGQLELVRRYIAWRKFDEAWGKLKILSRDIMAIQVHGIIGAQGKRWSEMGIHKAKMMTIEEAHDAIKSIKPPPDRPPNLHLQLRPKGRSGDIVLRTRDLRVGYPGKPLFVCDDIHLDRLERVAIIGPNGTGKTTFLRTLLGELPALGGEVSLGANLTIGYFAQTHDALERDNSVLDELLRHRNIPIPQARKHLAQYLFRGEDVQKSVGLLSGGERGRLALAILALDGVNCLLLDEPTNHLDIPAREVLQEGLERFDGTLLMVSHDRYLVADLATQIWDLRDGRLHVFKGPYSEWEESRELERLVQQDDARVERQERKRRVGDDKAERRRAQRAARLEAQIAETEAEMAQLSTALERCSDPTEVATLAQQYADVESRLAGLMEEWSEVADVPEEATVGA